MYDFVFSDITQEIDVAIMLQASGHKVSSLNWNFTTDCCK
jgi:hypothetical protein